MTLVYVLLVAHFVADFLCQSDWMALNKSKRWDALALHVAVYIAVLGVFVFPVVGTPFQRSEANGAMYVFLPVNAAAHFAQDAITSRINARLWQANERHWFFVSIGFDQLLHYVTLFATAGWLLHAR